MTRGFRAICLCAAVLIPFTGEAAGASQDPTGAFLKADGTALRDRNGRVVQLRGVNLGGWLEWQEWMCPIDSSRSLRDANPGHNGYDFEVRNLLVKRFGAAVAEELINTWRDAWIAERDLDNIHDLGLNVVRLPLSWDALLRDDGTWRPDAFERIDWLVANAWKRGLYTILDYHAFLPPAANQDGGANGYWTNADWKAETVRIWTRLASRYKGNPSIAMYDLLNEPNNSHLKDHPAPSAAVVCDLYDALYKAIRTADPEHPIAIQGIWDWRTLRDPGRNGHRNVVYSFHWYAWSSKTTADRNRATDNDLQSVRAMQQVWHVPAFIGEFNLFGDQDAWRYALEHYDQQKLSWTMWTWKNKASGSNSWGIYTTIPGKAPPVPNLLTDSADTIRRKWRGWATSPDTFVINPMFKPLFRSEAAH